MTRKIDQGLGTCSLFSNLIIQPNGKNSPSSNKADKIADLYYETSCGPVELTDYTIMIEILYHGLVIDVKNKEIAAERASVGGVDQGFRHGNEGLGQGAVVCHLFASSSTNNTNNANSTILPYFSLTT